MFKKFIAILGWIKLYYQALMNKATPRYLKLLLILALLYMLSPLDLIPEYIPVLGQVDDLAVILAAFIEIATGIPKDVLEKVRSNKPSSTGEGSKK